MHFGAQTPPRSRPRGVGGYLLFDKNFTSLLTAPVQSRHGRSFDYWSSSLVPGHSRRHSTNIYPVQITSCTPKFHWMGSTNLWNLVHSLGNPPIVVPSTTEIHPSSTNHGTGWTSRIITLIWTHCHKALLDRDLALHCHNQQTKNLARRHRAQFRIQFHYDLRNRCSLFVCNCWFHPSLEDHFSGVPDPTHHENWLALDGPRTLSHVAFRQQNITDYSTSIT
jgi:hypothetical protein